MVDVFALTGGIDAIRESARLARRDLLRSVLDDAGSRFLSATYTKVDGTVTKRVFQTKAGRALLAGDAASDSAKQAVETRKANHPNLVSLYDMTAHGWRSLNLDTVREIAVEGHKIEIPDIIA